MTTGRLTSFHHFRTVDFAEWGTCLDGLPIFADSGAFSAWSLGADVTVADYAAWLDRWAPRITVAANLDVIGDPEATWHNQLALEELGHRVLPVVHAGTPWPWLDRYLARGHTYICLGGFGGLPIIGTRRWIIQAMKMADGTAVFHGFGRTSTKEIGDFPWYSVDSASWSSGHRFGILRLLDDRCRWQAINVGDHASVYRQAALLRSYGIDPQDVADRTRYHHTKISTASAVAWHRYATHLRTRHGPIRRPAGGGPWDVPRTLGDGLHLFLAACNTVTVEQGACQALRELQEAC